MLKSESIVKLVEALHAAQLKFPPVERDTTNPHFRSKYATLDGAIKTLQPTLDEFGLTVFQPPCSDSVNGYTGITTILFHNSGEFFGDILLLPNAAPGGDKGGAQSATAAVTYARRTAYLATLGVAPEDDDDGNAANNRTTVQPPRQTQRPTQAAKPAAAKASTATQTAKPSGNSSGNSSAVPATSAAAPSKTVESAASTPTSAPVAAKPTDSTMPTEAEMNEFRAKFDKLRENLKEHGKIKASTTPAIPIAVKLRNFMTSIEGVKTPNNMSREQWLDFFSRADHVAGLDNGWVGLAKLVNKANGIEEAKK